MNAPVDLTNLRALTDGDSEMELALFEEFFNAFEEGISALNDFDIQNDNEIWRKQAHALKGIALNLGANMLADVCKHAQDINAAPLAKKMKTLNELQLQYAPVKQFLEEECARISA